MLFETESTGLIIGTDEAGRGPLAGPVYAAAVVLPVDFPFEILNDSKKLTEKQRILAAPLIREKALAWAVSWVSAEEIDRINILNASMKAMALAVSDVCELLKAKGLVPSLVMADGNRRPPVDLPCVPVVKGDSKIHEIMAASILAKTERDAYMCGLAKKWPCYGFEIHKGYPTKSHLRALQQFGPCPEHRLTFSGVCQH